MIITANGISVYDGYYGLNIWYASFNYVSYDVKIQDSSVVKRTITAFITTNFQLRPFYDM